MQDLLKYIAQNITGEQEIAVDESQNEGQTLYTIKAPKAVIGMLIGKEGKTIRAIRALARARAIKEQIMVNIQLEEV